MGERASDTRTATVLEPDGVPPSEPGRTIRYQPALDGVRALAVAVVLLFHAGVPGLSGGYLGVSVFFTLSGFLITSLLATEMQRDGRVAFGPFYARRARRLLPASVLVILLVAVAVAVTDWFDSIGELRAELLGSLFQVANWVFLAQDGSYQELLERSAGAASPLEHYWSLAIEEQFYWLWPLAFAGLWRLGRSRRGRIVALSIVTAVAVVAAPVIAAVWGADAAYWATPARAAEILVGALVGLVLVGRAVPAGLAWLAPAALVVLGVCVVWFPSSGGPAYSGWLPAVGVVSASLLVGLQAESATRRWVSLPVLVWLGRISYGVYLFHWPIFVVVNEERVGVDGPLLLAMRLVLTLVIAQVSFTFFESPLRSGVSLGPRRTLVTSGGATLAAAAAVFLLVPGPAGSYWQVAGSDADGAAIVVDGGDEPLRPLTAEAPGDGEASASAGGAESSDPTGGGSGSVGQTDGSTGNDDAASAGAATANAGGATDAGAGVAEDGAATSSADVANGDGEEAGDGVAASEEPAAAGSASTVPPTTTPEPIPEPSRPVRMLIVGDSTAEAVGAGIVGWASDHPDLAQAEVRSAPGCGFVRGGEFFLLDEWTETQQGCADYFYDNVPGQAAELSADLVVLVTGPWDVLDRRWDGSDVVESPMEYAERIRADFAELTSRYLDAGVAEVVWLEMPIPDPEWEPAVEVTEDPERHAVLHDAMAAAVDTFAGRVAVVDVGEWVDAQGWSDDRDIRPDGVHFTVDASTVLAEDLLGDRLLRIALGLV